MVFVKQLNTLECLIFMILMLLMLHQSQIQMRAVMNRMNHLLKWGKKRPPTYGKFPLEVRQKFCHDMDVNKRDLAGAADTKACRIVLLDAFGNLSVEIVGKF